MNRVGKGVASGKIILMGEHAVVYGKPAIALPFTQAKIETDVSYYKGETQIESSYYNGSLADAPIILGGIKHLIQYTLKYLKQENVNLKLVITSDLPSQRGLGSSAAVSISIVRGLFDYFLVSLTPNLLMELVTHAERIHHINPSGLDVNVIALGEPIVFRRETDPFVLNFKMDAYLVVADTGSMGQTREAVSSVKVLLDQNPESVSSQLDLLEELTNQTFDFLKNNKVNDLGSAMNKAQEILKDLGVSNEVLDKFIVEAIASGALGAKLTGSGKGGCMIALCGSLETVDKVKRALKNLGANALWTINMKEVEL